MKLSKEQVKKIAHLARLHLTDDEVELFAGQLTDILNYVDVLKELDTAGVPETNQVTGLTNVLREDVVSRTLCEPDALLACSPLPKEKHQIKSKKVL
ncbi:Asp-tRNA(Asn)/Glu-tRNA(Gln) amidotransferase subunit GatC [Candidatus Peregrinibacteria bacterium]|nr:Asp-tRNA(Asn)/Glu-tRNA(Gln) amidotransferase subunit GatC [Candidatus Peregrinibacteria bacterium]